MCFLSEAMPGARSSAGSLALFPHHPGSLLATDTVRSLKDGCGHADRDPLQFFLTCGGLGDASSSWSAGGAVHVAAQWDQGCRQFLHCR